MTEYTIENLFSIAIQQCSSSTKIKMMVHNGQINTRNIPSIINILERHLPNVLVTECFNDENLPFSVEVKKTEVGHLFEHILLEYLCQMKINKGYTTATYEGRTRWNWQRDPKGTFHIRLSCGSRDADILPQALDKTISLMKLILQYNQNRLSPLPRYVFTRNGLKNGKKSRKKRTTTFSSLKI